MHRSLPFVTLAAALLVSLGSYFQAQDLARPYVRELAAPKLAQGSRTPAASQRYGQALATLGDLDGNGSVDVAVGDPGGAGGGAVWIQFRKPDGTALRYARIGAPKVHAGPGAARPGAFGSSLAWLGDLDHDGKPELAVGAPGELGSASAGTVWLLSLAPDGSVASQSALRPGAAWEPANTEIATTGIGSAQAPSPSLQPTPQDGFGAALAAPGDLDGDGTPDLVVGAPRDSENGLDQGALWILYLNPQGGLRESLKINASHGCLGSVLRDGDRFGASIAHVGDLDGDGRMELAVGAPGSTKALGPAAPADAPCGVVWILFLAKQGGVRGQQRLAPPTQGDPSPGEISARRSLGTPEFGASLAHLGDLDGDGIADLAVGAPGAGAEAQGTIWLILLRPDGSSRAHQQLAQRELSYLHPLPPGAGLGQAITALPGGTQRTASSLIVAPLGTSPTTPARLLHISMEPCFSASVSLREASGHNPRILGARDLPRRGNPWHLTLDCSEDSLGLGYILGRTRPSQGLFTEAGEVLVDLSPSSSAFLIQAPHQGAPLAFSVPIPDDPATCNMALYVQGVCTSGNQARFSNALDIIVGR